MPYFDITTPEDFMQLFQVFVAAHPHHRAATEAMREKTQMPGDYFASLPMVEEMAAWARERQLITRRTARAMVARARLALSTDPGTVVQITRYLGPGAPPPTVEWGDCYRWICTLPAGPEERGRIFLHRAIELAEDIATDATVEEPVRLRAALLHEWLQAQQQA